MDSDCIHVRPAAASVSEFELDCFRQKPCPCSLTWTSVKCGNIMAPISNWHQIASCIKAILQLPFFCLSVFSLFVVMNKQSKHFKNRLTLGLLCLCEFSNCLYFSAIKDYTVHVVFEMHRSCGFCSVLIGD